MAFLAKAKKLDLRVLAEEMGEVVTEDLKIIELKEKIIKSDKYDEEFVKILLNTIMEERKAKEDEEKLALAQINLEKERNFELEKMRLNLESNRNNSQAGSPMTTDIELPHFEMRKLIPTFNPKEDDMGLYLNLFERQLKFLKLAETKWVACLIGVLPTEVAKLIAREPEENAQNYSHVKEMLLKRYKLTSEKFRQLFSQHRKSTESTWRDFYFELRTYFEGWLSELQVTEFDQLKDLIIADQIKKRTPSDFRDHFIDDWMNWNLPSELADKLDTYESMRCNSKTATPAFKTKTISSREEIFKNTPKKSSYPQKPHRSKPEIKKERTTVVCYGCGNPGFIKSKCPKCTSCESSEVTQFGNIVLHSCSTTSSQVVTLKLTVNGIWGTACADTGASHSIAGEVLYRLLQEKGIKFQESVLTMSLADGQKTEVEVQKACVEIGLEGRFFRTTLLALPHAIGNRTLLGTDFLAEAGIVLNLRKRNWYFHNAPYKAYDFVEEADLETLRQTCSIEANSCCLRKEEGQHLTEMQKGVLNNLLRRYKSTFSPGGEPTPFSEHRIDTGDAPPVATTPYQLSPARKEILKKEIDALLSSGVIEECDSPYASPVVLIPKPNGDFRLCIDYRKLNAVTKSDPYPLPRMDDLLQSAKQTAFMSTIDLKSGYHQIKMYPPDKDKTAFVCPYGVFRFNRMPFGLKTAPATFQRLMDLFCNGLKVNTLTYLDDIIVMSSTFEEHLEDLKSVFERLNKFKLHANRSKCHFVCSKVKYLGHYITSSGIEVDPSKVKAIEEIPSPKNVKQVQSFLQTCSWYRRYIPNFAEISRPLSNLTKKSSTWKWGKEEQTAFECLKKSLISPPVLKQVDETKPFVLRTDASNYALGAVLIQGQGQEEHPIEFASRLLTSAERNYSTTEREALAVVWALGKFRGYIEGSPITVVSDHQPLKWLLSLKSPTGRLARWALQIQSYDLKIEYITGRTNVIADMLSRPVCKHEKSNCDICTVVVDLPTRSASDIRKEQLKDTDLRKIIDCFESDLKDENYLNWTNRGYIMSQGLLYRYAPEAETEEAQLVVPAQERERILKEYHDAPTAGHYGAEGTFHRIASRYYFPGMRSYINDYVKNCADCSRYKPSNQKPTGLLRTPVYSQRFETLSIDLFGPLPESPNGKKWIFIIEDCCTRWVELFALTHATARECAITLLEEVIFRYGLPRRLISDHGTQFVSSVMQQLCYLMKIDQAITPVYHPQANPVERKNRDLKPRIAILVQDKHDEWEDKLPVIRFAMNSAKCDTTGKTAAYLQFGREMRTIDDVTNDFRAIVNNENFVPEITPYLKRLANISTEIRERVEAKQDERKLYADKRRRNAPQFQPGDKVWVTLHPLSNAARKKTAKFMPKRDGPYVVVTQRSPTTYEVAHPDNLSETLGPYHTSALRLCSANKTTPIMPLRKRGRPKNANYTVLVPNRGRFFGTRGGVCNGQNSSAPCGRTEKQLV